MLHIHHEHSSCEVMNCLFFIIYNQEMLNLVDQHLLEVQVVLSHQEVPLGLYHLQRNKKYCF